MKYVVPGFVDYYFGVLQLVVFLADVRMGGWYSSVV